MTEDQVDQVNQHVLGIIFQHYNFKAGLKKYGNEGNKAINETLQQHHDMTAFVPMDGTMLSRKEQTYALGVLMFITQKRDGIVKTRKCADGRGQCGTISKEEAMLPPCSTSAIFITTAMEARNGCDISMLTTRRQLCMVFLAHLLPRRHLT